MLRHVGSNWLLSAFQILVVLILSPFVVQSLGVEAFGVWVIVVAMTNFIGILVLGLPMASVRHVAEHVATGDTTKMNRAIATCLGMALGLSLIALAAGVALFSVFKATYLADPQWAGLSHSLTAEAQTAMGLMVLNVAAGFVGRLPYALYDAHQDFVARNLVMGSGLSLRLILTLWLLAQTPTLVVLASILLSVMASEFVVALFVIKRRHPAIRFSLKAFDKKLTRGVLSFSLFAMLLNVGSRLAFQSNALVIGWFMLPEDATRYDIGNKIFGPLTNVFLGLSMVVLPLATSLKANLQEEDLRLTLLKWTKVAWSIAILSGLYLLVLGPHFLSLWFRDVYHDESGELLQVLMVSFLFFYPVRAVALPLLMGIGHAARPALALLLMGILNVVISLALIEKHGLIGVALGTAIPNALFAAAVFVMACREVQLPVIKVLSHTLGRSTLGALPVLGLLLWIERYWTPTDVPSLLLSGLATLGLFGIVWVGFVYRNDPHINLSTILTRQTGETDAS